MAQPIPCGPNLFTENMNKNTKIMLQESPRGLANFYRSFGKCEQIFNDSNVWGHVPSFYQTWGWRDGKKKRKKIAAQIVIRKLIKLNQKIKQDSKQMVVIQQ